MSLARGCSIMIASVAVLSLAPVATPIANAKPATAPPQVAAVIEGKTLETSLLLGVSGQVYRPVATGGWKRSGRGGVACRVIAGFEIGGELWALCSRAPLFKRVGNVWSAEPLNNRGRTRASPVSAKPLISIGRHLYGLKGSKWERLSSAPSRITSLLASSPRSGYAVSSRRELLRISGASWKVVIAPPKRRKPTDDLPLALFGSPRNAYVIFDSGAIHNIATTKTKAVSLPANISAFTPSASCAESTGSVLAIGTATRKDKESTELLRFSGTTAVVAGDAPSLEKGDRSTLLHCSGERALLATALGRLYIRDAGAWTAHALDSTPEAEPEKTTPGSHPAMTP